MRDTVICMLNHGEQLLFSVGNCVWGRDGAGGGRAAPGRVHGLQRPKEVRYNQYRYHSKRDCTVYNQKATYLNEMRKKNLNWYCKSFFTGTF